MPAKESAMPMALQGLQSSHKYDPWGSIICVLPRESSDVWDSQWGVTECLLSPISIQAFDVLE